MEVEKLGRRRQAARHLRRDTTAWGLRPLAPELTVHTGYPRTEKAAGPPERPSGSRTWAMPGRLCWAPRQEVLRSHPTCWLSGSRMAGAGALLPGEPSVAGLTRGRPRPSTPAGGGVGSQVKPARAGAGSAAHPPHPWGQPLQPFLGWLPPPSALPSLPLQPPSATRRAPSSRPHARLTDMRAPPDLAPRT